MAAQVEPDGAPAGTQMGGLVRPVDVAPAERVDEDDGKLVTRPVVVDVQAPGRTRDVAGHGKPSAAIDPSSLRRGLQHNPGVEARITEACRPQLRPSRCARGSQPGMAPHPGGRQASFHVSTTAVSRSQPRTEMVAVPSANSAPDGRRQAEPARGQDAEQVAVRKDQDVAVRPPGPGR